MADTPDERTRKSHQKEVVGEVSTSSTTTTAPTTAATELDISSGGVVRSVIRSLVERLTNISRSSKGFKLPRVGEIKVPKPRAVVHSAEHLKEILEFNESYHHTVNHSHSHSHENPSLDQHGGNKQKQSSPSSSSNTSSSSGGLNSQTKTPNSNNYAAVTASGAATAATATATTASITAKAIKYWKLVKQVGPAFLKTSLLCTVLYSSYENIHDLRRISTFEPFSERGDEHFQVHSSLAEATLWAASCGTAAGVATSVASCLWDEIAGRYRTVQQQIVRLLPRSVMNTAIGVTSSISTGVPTVAATTSAAVAVATPRVVAAWSGSLAYHSLVSGLLFAVYEPIKTKLMQSAAYQSTVNFSYQWLSAASSRPSATAHKEEHRSHHLNTHRAAHFVADFGCILAAGSAAGIFSDVVGYFLAPLEHMKLLGTSATATTTAAPSAAAATVVASRQHGASLDPLKTFSSRRAVAINSPAAATTAAMEATLASAPTTGAATNSLRELFRLMRSMPAPTLSSILLTSVPHCVAFFAYEYGKSRAAAGSHH